MRALDMFECLWADPWLIWARPLAGLNLGIATVQPDCRRYREKITSIAAEDGRVSRETGLSTSLPPLKKDRRSFFQQIKNTVSEDTKHVNEYFVGCVLASPRWFRRDRRRVASDRMANHGSI
jgi:hypothetical protein